MRPEQNGFRSCLFVDSIVLFRFLSLRYARLGSTATWSVLLQYHVFAVRPVVNISRAQCDDAIITAALMFSSRQPDREEKNCYPPWPQEVSLTWRGCVSCVPLESYPLSQAIGRSTPKSSRN